jgi:hypothetical protein
MLILSSHLRRSLLRGLFLVGLLVKIFKGLLPSILATCLAHFNFIDLFTHEVPHCEAFSTLLSYPF